MGCLAIFFVERSVARSRTHLYFSFRNGLQQLTIPLHSASPLQQSVLQFYGNINKGACAHLLFFVPRSIARQVAGKIAQCNRAFMHRHTYQLRVFNVKFLKSRIFVWVILKICFFLPRLGMRGSQLQLGIPRGNRGGWTLPPSPAELQHFG